ncbi:MAG: Asp-tRNA(Asn)/Glu-tRNA(Gln) amidotransferase subunit GatC [Alphaproteobacteria bacterium]|nr:MAG: Asp-tRNA(Asn)/Glu-tRNA(Gln) amidotransferase subunit GatC [Alphaproteobacteria bacterium]
MAIDAATVRKIAHLARIRLEDGEIAPLADELSRILGWVEQLGAVDTAGVAAMTSVVESQLFLREDEVRDGEQADAVLANAPRAEFGFFSVPKVIE